MIIRICNIDMRKLSRPPPSVTDPNPDPYSMGSWIRIANADPDPEGEKSPKKKKIT
jgi:hypothetical protein